MSLSNYVSVKSLSAYVIDFLLPTPSHSLPPLRPGGRGLCLFALHESEYIFGHADTALVETDASVSRRRKKGKKIQ